MAAKRSNSAWTKAAFDARLSRAWKRYQEDNADNFRFGREEFLRSLRQQWMYVFGYQIDAGTLSASKRLDIKDSLTYTSRAEQIFRDEEPDHPITLSSLAICAWIRSIENRICISRGLPTWESLPIGESSI